MLQDLHAELRKAMGAERKYRALADPLIRDRSSIFASLGMEADACQKQLMDGGAGHGGGPLGRQMGFPPQSEPLRSPPPWRTSNGGRRRWRPRLPKGSGTRCAMRWRFMPPKAERCAGGNILAMR